MASMLTPEDVVRGIAAECTFIDDRGAVGIRLMPAAAIVHPIAEPMVRRLAAGERWIRTSGPSRGAPDQVRCPERPHMPCSCCSQFITVRRQ